MLHVSAALNEMRTTAASPARHGYSSHRHFIVYEMPVGPPPITELASRTGAAPDSSLYQDTGQTTAGGGKPHPVERLDEWSLVRVHRG